MTANDSNLFPTDHLLRTRDQREALLGQRSLVVWMYGLSGSGKTTLANALDRRLAQDGFRSHVLDGDNVRRGLNSGLGFSDGDRRENIRRVAEVAKLFADAGMITINCFITPHQELRDMARGIVGSDKFFDVFIDASFEECQRRDPKGLYKKANAGNVTQFTGKDSGFERPEKPDLLIETEKETRAQSLDRIYAAVIPRVILNA